MPTKDKKPTDNSKPKKKSQKPVTAPQGGPLPPGGPVAAGPAGPAETQNFLLVKVSKGAKRKELIDAMNEALKAKEVPFFKERKLEASSAETTSSGGSATSEDGPALKPNEALLMLVRQEGNPNG